MSVSDPGSALPSASNEASDQSSLGFGPSSEANEIAARPKLEQLISDALAIADEEMLQAMSAGAAKVVIEKKDSGKLDRLTFDARPQMKGRSRITSQEFSKDLYFGSEADNTAELKSQRESQRQETLAKFRPIGDPTTIVSSLHSDSVEFDKVKRASNEFLDSLGRRPSASTNIEDEKSIDEHDEDWALRER